MIHYSSVLRCDIKRGDFAASIGVEDQEDPTTAVEIPVAEGRRGRYDFGLLPFSAFGSTEYQEHHQPVLTSFSPSTTLPPFPPLNKVFIYGQASKLTETRHFYSCVKSGDLIGYLPPEYLVLLASHFLC